MCECVCVCVYVCVWGVFGGGGYHSDSTYYPLHVVIRDPLYPRYRNHGYY